MYRETPRGSGRRKVIRDLGFKISTEGLDFIWEFLCGRDRWTEARIWSVQRRNFSLRKETSHLSSDIPLVWGYRPKTLQKPPCNTRQKGRLLRAHTMTQQWRRRTHSGTYTTSRNPFSWLMVSWTETWCIDDHWRKTWRSLTTKVTQTWPTFMYTRTRSDQGQHMFRFVRCIIL